MLLQVILEGLGLGALLFLVCAVGIRKGAVGMVHLYSPAVREAGTYNTRKNKAKCFDFQSGMRSRLHRLCAGLCLWDKRCTQLCGGLLAAAGHLVRYESHGPLFDRWLLGGAHERMDDSRNRGLKALYYRQGQGEKVAVRHGGHGSHSDGAGGNDDSTVIGKTLLSAAFSASSQGSGTTG